MAEADEPDPPADAPATTDPSADAPATTDPSVDPPGTTVRSDDDAARTAPTLATGARPLGPLRDAGASNTQPDGGAAAPLHPTVLPSTAAPLPASTPPGMPQDARYAITVEIARGGMGRVVEATDTVLGRTVALKEALSLDPETIRRFQRETRITARLEHPAIVPVHDAGSSPSGVPFYVMRKVSGRPLEDFVARYGELNDRLALVPHIVTAAQAIAHAHARGIVHRDIKPANILVGDLGETIVIDWGLAKGMDEPDETGEPVQRVLAPDEDDGLKTRAGIVFGTPGFMAPEQLRGAPLDERCDVYALGATLYHLLARRPPHHDKQAEKMMRAAVDGPPIPLTEIVSGVPPELATIVDKAIAHDRARRYPNAGALAEDLQRFLTGQLVASHHYSRSERIARFVRKHRAAVAIAAGATVALVVGAAIAFQQIRGERDRADEAARSALTEKRIAEEQKEEIAKKARELTLANARHAATTDPTRAAAMVKPLAATELWRHARDVGAAARASGVAYSIPASHRTLSLELSRDGRRALAAGTDGIVRLVDLGTRTTRELANMRGAVMARFADGERTVVLYQGNRLTLVDAATGDRREVVAPTKIATLDVSGPLAYWVDSAGAVWKLDVAGGAPTQVSLPEPIALVAPSPDGRWIALGGTRHLLLIDRSRPTLPPENISEGVVSFLRWSADSRRLAVQIDNEVLDINTVPFPQIFDRYLLVARFGLAYGDGRIYSSGANGVRQLVRPDPKLRLADPGHTLGLYEGRDRVVIAAKPQGQIVVLSRYGDHTLEAPVPIQAVATSATSPWIVAAADGMLLVWNLDDFEPRAYRNDVPTGARFVTADTLIVTYFDDTAEWIDLRTRKATQLGEMSELRDVVVAPDGAEAIVLGATRRAWRVAGVGRPSPLPGEVVAAAFVDSARLAIAGTGGVRLEDTRQNTQLALLAHAAEARDLDAAPHDGGWVAGSFADGLVWRKHLGGTTETSLRLPAPVPARLPIALARDGTVIVGAGTELRAWRADGDVDVLVRTTAPIHDVARVEPAHVLAIAEDGTGYLVEMRGPASPVTLPVSRHASAAAGGLIAAPTATGGVEVIDAVTRWRWPLAIPQKGFGRPFSYVEIARDGSRVLAVTSDEVVVWNLDLPKTAEETAAWLDQLTNATAEGPTGPLAWR